VQECPYRHELVEGFAWPSALWEEKDAPANGTRFALFVDDHGLSERTPVADVQVQRSGLDPLDDLSQLRGIAADAERHDPHVSLGVLHSGRNRDEDASRFGDVEERSGVVS
jgi:hypothetical protein